MSGLTANNLCVACGVGAATCKRNSRKRARKHLHLHAATASWRTKRNPIRPIIGTAATQSTRCVIGIRREHPRPQRQGFSFPITARPLVKAKFSSRSLFFYMWGGGVQAGSPLHVGHWMAYCTCPGWLWWWRNWWNKDWQGKPKYSEKTCPSATLSTTNPTW
jgi:hypothetical protein